MRRLKLLQLTPKGRRLERKLADIGVRWSESMVDGTNARNLERAVTLIRDVVRRLDESS